MDASDETRLVELLDRVVREHSGADMSGWSGGYGRRRIAGDAVR